MIKNCKDKCQKIRSVDEEKSMEMKLDDYYLYRKKRIIKWNGLCVPIRRLLVYM